MRFRKFRSGDRVRKKENKQIMIVFKNCLKQHPFCGSYLSDNELECVWYENGIRMKAIFDQRTLTKVSVYSGTLNCSNHVNNERIQEYNRE